MRLKPNNAGLTGHCLVSIGSSKLYEYGEVGQPIMIIPSMINKAYIMDLPNRSLVKSLCDQGFKPYVIEWGDPGDAEAMMDLNDYILDRLNQFVDHIITKNFEAPVLLGYCMGGIMATLYASMKPDKVKAIVQLAAPWDFTKSNFIRILPQKLLKCFRNQTFVPKEFFQLGFYIRRFADINQKYIEFAKKKFDNSEFIEVESWIDDGIDMPKLVFAQLIDDIIYRNKLIQSTFRIGNTNYDITSIEVPQLSIVSSRDSVVPVDSAIAIRDTIPSTDIVYLSTGHVGLVTSSRVMVAESIKLWIQHKKINKTNSIC